MSGPPEVFLGFQPFLPDLKPFFLSDTALCQIVDGALPDRFRRVDGRLRRDWADPAKSQIVIMDSHPVLARRHSVEPAAIPHISSQIDAAVLQQLRDRELELQTGDHAKRTISEVRFMILAEDLVMAAEQRPSSQRICSGEQVSSGARNFPALALAKKLAAIAYVAGNEMAGDFLTITEQTHALRARLPFTWGQFNELLPLFANGKVMVYDLEKQFQLARKILLASLRP